MTTQTKLYRLLPFCFLATLTILSACKKNKEVLALNPGNAGSGPGSGTSASQVKAQRKGIQFFISREVLPFYFL